MIISMDVLHILEFISLENTQRNTYRTLSKQVLSDHDWWLDVGTVQT